MGFIYYYILIIIIIGNTQIFRVVFLERQAFFCFFCFKNAVKVIPGISRGIIIAGSPMCVFPKENVQVRHRTRARGKILQKVCSRRHFFDDFCFKVCIRIKIAGWFCKKCSGAAARVIIFNMKVNEILYLVCRSLLCYLKTIAGLQGEWVFWEMVNFMAAALVCFVCRNCSGAAVGVGFA